MTITANPFATLIASAQQREAEIKESRNQQADEAATNRAAAEAQARAEQEAAAARQRLVDFGREFLMSVATRVVDPRWSAAYIMQVQEYSEGLLRNHSVQLPGINPKHADKILDRLCYGLHLAEVHNAPIPEGMFYGQTLLRERGIMARVTDGTSSSWSQPTGVSDQPNIDGQVSIKYVPDPRKGKLVHSTETAPQKVELKPAFTTGKKAAKPKGKAA